MSEFGKRMFCCATEIGVKKETELIVLADIRLVASEKCVGKRSIG